jgi:hypothetical protein
MSQTLPQSQLGPIVTKPFVDGFARVLVANEEALVVKNLQPQPTVWGGKSGRPIYDRLPGVSEAYRKEYAGEIGRGMVYVDPQFGSLTGPGSLEVGAWEEDRRVLVVYDGLITWANGQVPTETFAFNLETIIDGGVQDGLYQVGYYLDTERSEAVTYTKYRVENTSLGGSATVYDVTREAPNHPLEKAIADFREGTWKPTEFALVGEYDVGTSVTFDFTEKVVAEEFLITARLNSRPTAFCALYRSDDAISWYLEDSVSPNETGWALRNSFVNGSRYYRLFFWGGTADVLEVKYTGEALFPNQRPVGPISVTELFLEPAFDQIDRPHILLALIDVRNFRIVEIQDKRSTTAIKYEPVARWLTDFQDITLKSLFTDVEQYSSLYMSPTDGAKNFYKELLGSNIVISDDVFTPTIIFPEIVKQKESEFVSGVQVQANNITPLRVILLEDPEDASDLATTIYAEQTLIPSLDNGQY